MTRGEDDYSRRLAAKGPMLSATALRIVRFIDVNRSAVVAASATRLARRIGTSDATVIRSVQALGYEGWTDLKDRLAVTLDERPTPAENMRRTLARSGTSVDRAVEEVLSAHAESIAILQAAEARAEVAAAVAALAPTQRVVVFGIGPSAHLARYASHMLVRNGRSSTTLDATGWGLADQLIGLQKGDAVCMLAYGRPYAEATAALAVGRRLGLPIVLVTDAAQGALALRADVVISARRGRAGRVALHAATLVVLEALVLGLAAIDGAKALDALRRLDDLRDLAAPRRETGDAGPV